MHDPHLRLYGSVVEMQMRAEFEDEVWSDPSGYLCNNVCKMTTARESLQESLWVGMTTC